MVNNTRKGVDLLPEKCPAIKNVITWPQPIWQTQVIDPLQEELKVLNEHKIQAMAEMDVQEELEDEEEEHLRTSHVVNITSMDRVDDIEEFSDRNQENPNSDFIADGEESQDQEELVRAVMRAPANNVVASADTNTEGKETTSKKTQGHIPIRSCLQLGNQGEGQCKKDSGLAKSHKDTKQLTTLSYDFGGLADKDAFTVAPVNLSGKNCNVNHMNEPQFIDISNDSELEPSKTEVIIPAASGDSGPPAASGADSGLLVFTQSHWVTCFISTLTNCLASALDLWDIGGGADIIVVFQGVVDKVYLDSHYQVKFGDKIYSMLNSWATKSDHQIHEVGNPKRWSHGMENPTLMECTVESSSPDYIKPLDVFESPFMITLLTPFLKSCQGSCYDYGNLKGAVTLGVVALHHAFSMYTTGVHIRAHQFSCKNASEAVAFFATNTESLTDCRWAQIKKSYSANPSGKGKQKAVDIDLLDEQQFHELYVPSSL
ncbi:hypothetical protein BJV74DRAFT_796107 [Russula compacta]|nr:hypothetical protein BJV74DRAFT_796107 [Russula compacta]